MKSSRSGMVLGLFAIVLMLSGCAQQAGPAPGLNWPGTANAPLEYPPSTFAHRIGSPAVELFWNCTQSGGALQVTGIAYNQWFAGEVMYLNLDLVGVDAKGREVSYGKAREVFKIFTLRYAEFDIALQPTGNEVRYDLYYQYQYREPGDRDTGEKHTKSRPVSPNLIAANGPILLAQVPPTYFLARDVCSPTKLRAR